MPQLKALTPEEFERVAERLRNPAPGSKIAAARDYGIDLTLLIAQLRLTPQERLKRLEHMVGEALELRDAKRRRR